MVMTKEQFDYVQKLLPLTALISEWSKLKAEFCGVPSPGGIDQGLILAEIILQSDWGKHPLAQPVYINRYSNNLALVPCGDYYKGKSNTHEGVEYRAYKDWKTFAVDYSDYLTFSRQFDNILKEYRLHKQVELLSLTKTSPETYTSNIIEIISMCSEVVNGKRKTI